MSRKIMKFISLMISILVISTIVFAAESDKSTEKEEGKISEESNEIEKKDTDKDSVKKYRITTVAGKGGKISPQNPEVAEGQDQTFMFLADSDYKIKSITVDGEPIGTFSLYTLRNINKEHKVVVQFVKVMNEATREEMNWDNKFKDVNSGDWFYDSIRYVSKHNLFNGITETEFAPNGNLTRGMLVTVLFRFSNAIEYARSTFDDVPKDAYYSQAISWATKMGIVNGIGDNKFAPDEYVTRQDLASIIYRYARFKGRGFAISNSYLLDYADRDAIADYAYEAICWCTTTKVLNGKDGNIIDPVGNATRAETSAIMQRLATALD